MIVTCIFLTIGLTMWVFTALLLTSRTLTPTSYLLGACIFCLGYVWLYFGLYRTPILPMFPRFIYSELFFEYLAGPFLYYYTKSLAGSSPHLSIKRAIPFLPALVFGVYLILFAPGSGMPQSGAAGGFPTYFASTAIEVFNTLADIEFFGFVVVSTYYIIKLYLSLPKGTKRAIRGILAYYVTGTATILGVFLGHLLQSDAILGVSVLVNGINTTYYFFLSQRYPEYTQQKIPIPGQGGASTAQAAPVDEKLLAQLSHVVEIEGAYREPDISLQTLSDRLGIPHHRLSRILNKGLGMNFRRYINRCRIAEAKRLLAEQPEVPIINIVFAVGFNSKSVFNAAFTKELGVAPSKYRKTMKKRPKFVNQVD
jgi:AraC-like DNA-binding protein